MLSSSGAGGLETVQSCTLIPVSVKRLGVRKGGFIKGGLAIYALPLCNCNTLGSVFNVEIDNMPNCLIPLH